MSNHYRSLEPFTDEQLKNYQAAFVQQSRQLHDQQGSLAWLDSLITSWDSNLRTNQPVAVLELGGTNLRYGIAVSHDGNSITWLVPPKTELAQNIHANPSSFINWISDFVFQLFRTHHPTQLGFILSYPHQTHQFGNHLTATITKLTKAFHTPGLIGTDIGRALLSRLESQGHPVDRLVILNDAVGALLSHRQAAISLVVGTGGNMAAVHPQLANIRNIEAGNFDTVPHTLASILIDTWENSGEQSLEKQTSGRYLHRLLTNQLLIEGISPQTLMSLGLINGNNGAETVSQIASQKVDWSVLDIPTEQQQQITSLAQSLLHSSAQIWGALVAGAIELNHQQLPENLAIPVTGAVVLQSPGYIPLLLDTITKLTSKSVELIPIEDPIQGAAIAVLKE